MTSAVPRHSRHRVRLGHVVGLALGLAGSPTALAQSAGAAPVSYQDAHSPQMRVAIVGYRLAARNAQRCGRTAPLTGLLLHDLSAYDEGIRPQVAAHYGLGDGIGVLGVVPGSVADDAGLQVGDELIALDREPVSRLPLPPATRVATFDRVEALHALLVSHLRNGPVTLTVRRDRLLRDLTLPPRLGCAALVTMVPGTRPEAWSDSHYAAITEGLAQVADEDELAFALAHEMAHVMLGHAAETRGALAGITTGSSRSRDRERAADALGITMVLEAGYREGGAQAVLDRFARANPAGFSLTHPSTKSRIAAIRAAAAAFMAGR